MKTTDEMVESLFDRREQFKIERRKKATRIVSVIAIALGASALLGVGIRQMNQVEKAPSEVTTAAETAEVAKPRQDETPAVVWAENSAENVEMLDELEGKLVTARLSKALAEDGGAVFAILARPAVDYDYMYDGKTLAAYFTAMCDERNLPERLAQRNQEGDDLKLGAALYEIGTPEGVKWAKSFYEERVAYYGKSFCPGIS